MNSNSKIKSALVGCGRIANDHFRSMEQTSGYDLRYVCDVIPERAHQGAEKYGGLPVLDHVEIPHDEIDLVSICTPNYLHYPMVKHFLDRGKHVVVEKPVTIDINHLFDLRRIAQENNLRIFPIMQVRYNPAIRAVKNAVDVGQLGKMISCNLVMHWNRPQEYFDSDDWRGNKEKDGGTFINQGIHYLDLLTWVMGPVKSVYVVAETLNHTLDVEDHLSAIMRFENGAIGTIEFNVNTYPRNLECTHFFQGERGSVKVGGRAANEIEIWEVENVPQPVLPESIAPNVYAGGLYQGSCPNHAVVYENVRDVLLHGKEPHFTIDDAEISLKLIEAMYLSAKLGKEVVL